MLKKTLYKIIVLSGLLFSSLLASNVLVNKLGNNISMVENYLRLAMDEDSINKHPVPRGTGCL